MFKELNSDMVKFLKFSQESDKSLDRRTLGLNEVQSCFTTAYTFSHTYTLLSIIDMKHLDWKEDINFMLVVLVLPAV